MSARQQLQERRRRVQRLTVSARVQRWQERFDSIRKPEFRKDSRVAREVEGEA